MLDPQGQLHQAQEELCRTRELYVTLTVLTLSQSKVYPPRIIVGGVEKGTESWHVPMIIESSM